MKKPEDFEEYMLGFPFETQEKLAALRETIKKAAPTAVEVISYGMPALKLNGMLLYYAAFKNHIGFYPMASGIEFFKSRFTGLKWAKGSVQFPLNKPLPLDLVAEIVKFRVSENLQKAKPSISKT